MTGKQLYKRYRKHHADRAHLRSWKNLFQRSRDAWNLLADNLPVVWL